MDQFTDKAKEALELSCDTAEELGHNYVGSEHLLCGLIRQKTGVAARVLANCNVEENAVISLIDKFVSQHGSLMFKGSAGYTPSAKRILEQSAREAIRFHSEKIGTEHLLIAILKDGDCAATRIINTLGVNIQKIYSEILHAMGEDVKEAEDESGQKSSTTPTLDQYSRDLT